MIRPEPYTGSGRILAQLAAGPMTSRDLRDALPGWVNVSAHLVTLERRGLVRVDADRRPFRYAVQS